MQIQEAKGGVVTGLALKALLVISESPTPRPALTAWAPLLHPPPSEAGTGMSESGRTSGV